VAGSFTCTCKLGYTGNGLSCADINECANSPCGTGGTCSNLENAYSCACAAGYSGGGKNKPCTCTPINGGWSGWSGWSTCTGSSCGTGTQSHTRTCNNPSPNVCGASCSGASSQSKSCDNKCNAGCTGHCSDGVKNCDEGDVDCGGASCSACQPTISGPTSGGGRPIKIVANGNTITSYFPEYMYGGGVGCVTAPPITITLHNFTATGTIEALFPPKCGWGGSTIKTLDFGGKTIKGGSASPNWAGGSTTYAGTITLNGAYFPIPYQMQVWPLTYSTYSVSSPLLATNDGKGFRFSLSAPEGWKQIVDVAIALPPASGTSKTCGGSSTNYCNEGLKWYVEKSFVQASCDNYCAGSGNLYCTTGSMYGNWGSYKVICNAYSFVTNPAFTSPQFGIFACKAGGWKKIAYKETVSTCHLGQNITCKCP
jgi:hypothetical protein